MSNTSTGDAVGGVAIIGMSGRFPGARNITEFWQNLRDGIESITFFSDEELLEQGVDDETLRYPAYVKAKGVLEGVELFDASFFGFSPREAEIMDPQQRLFLECVWETLEVAGYDPERYPGLIGVYAGTGMSSYLYNVYANPTLVNLMGEFQIALVNDKDHLTTHASYKLNLKGPSVAVQTACSTSLVAVCMACQSLLNYQCDMALAGGVSIYLPQKAGYYYQEGAIASPDGHCRAFDARAKGTVGGSGLGVVLLKRLEDAIADGDTIHAVIKGSAINNDGSLKVGYTAPSVDGQAEVIVMAQAMAEVEPETITYIEAHGTGTELGDPIEIAALTQAFRASTEEKNFCAIGSVKTNIGHLDPAAGIAGLIKTVLALEHKSLPPSLHFEAPNPKIDFANSPFYVNNKLSEWKVNEHPRRAGVSSFGIGGTNAHVVLEEAPTSEDFATSRPWYPLVLSARTSTALDTATTNLAAYLKQHANLNLVDVAYTYGVGRRAFGHRRAILCQSLDDAVSALETLDPQRVLTAYQESHEESVTFMFSGQGAQYVNMGLELYEVEPTFRGQIDLCCELLRPHLGSDLRAVLYPNPGQAKEAEQQLRQTYMAQPALFIIEYALAKLWVEWGIRPRAMIGHSIGEYVAACLAGVFSLEDAVALVAARGRLMQQMPTGAMLAVSLSEKELRPFLNGKLSLAAINAPSQCVVSGPTDAVAELQIQLDGKGVHSHQLQTSHAFHSAMMEPILEPFIEQVKKVELSPPRIPYVSNVTGTWITAEEATDPSYWAKHLRHTVRFANGVQKLVQELKPILLEVGPGQTLSTLAGRHSVNASNHPALSSLRHPRGQQSDIRFILNTLNRLWLSGAAVDWTGFYAHERRRRIPLPTYPFERQRYWVERDEPTDNVSPHQPVFNKLNVAEWFYIPSWQRTMPPVSFNQKAQVEQKLCWLVFSDECGLGHQLVKRLKQLGQDVVTVIPGEQFAHHDKHTYTINPRQPDDYAFMLKGISKLGKTPNVIAHLWSVTQDEQMSSNPQSFARAQETGFYSLLYLAKALGKYYVSDHLQIAVVSNHMHAVTGEETLCPEKSTVLGPCKVIPQEYPHISCRSIDVVLPASGVQSNERLVEQLIAELTAESPDSVVAYRGLYRWTQTFEPIRFDKATATSLEVKERGVYLITGGLGNIGLLFAGHLAQTAQAKLALVGRSPFPARADWEQWLTTHDEQDETSYKIRKIRAMEEAGAEVLVMSADVTALGDMQSVIERTIEQFGSLNGVIHGAGLLAEDSFVSIQEISQTVCERHFRPKAYGLYVLEKVLEGRQLDFCLLLSSLSSVLGGLGFAAYSAANIFMDAFAHLHHRTDSVPWVSVDWDAWRFPSDDDQSSAAGRRRSELSIYPDEGVEAFQRVLSLSPQVIVSTGDLQTRIDQWINPSSTQEEIGEAQDLPPISSQTTLQARPNLPNTYVAPRNDMERTISDTMGALLGVNEVGVYDNFFELGGHSLLAIQLISRLRDTFRVELPVHTIFNSPTVAQLAETLEKNQQAQEGDEKKLAQMLQYVEQLSENEVKTLLAQQKD